MFKTKKSIALFIILDIVCVVVIFNLVSGFSKKSEFKLSSKNNSDEIYDEDSLKEIPDETSDNSSDTPASTDEQNNNIIIDDVIQTGNNTQNGIIDNNVNNPNNIANNNPNNTQNNGVTPDNGTTPNNEQTETPKYTDPTVNFSRNYDIILKTENNTFATVSNDYISSTLEYGISNSSSIEPSNWKSYTNGSIITINNWNGSAFVWIKVKNMNNEYKYFKSGSFNMCTQYPDIILPQVEIMDKKFNTRSESIPITFETKEYAVYSFKFSITLSEVLKIKNISYLISTTQGVNGNYTSISSFKNNTPVEQAFGPVTNEISIQGDIPSKLYITFKITDIYDRVRTITKEATFNVQL